MELTTPDTFMFEIKDVIAEIEKSFARMQQIAKVDILQNIKIEIRKSVSDTACEYITRKYVSAGWARVEYLQIVYGGEATQFTFYTN